MGTAVLAYTLGLRHALDADHISVCFMRLICLSIASMANKETGTESPIFQAIDLMTRRLIASGQRPVTVGMCFSLGHSTSVGLCVKFYTRLIFTSGSLSLHQLL